MYGSEINNVLSQDIIMQLVLLENRTVFNISTYKYQLNVETWSRSYFFIF